jgi:predicted CXXCH cytochrome family protein
MNSARLAVFTALGVVGLLGAASAVSAQQMPSSESCIACHIKLQDERLSAPARTFSTDIHAQKGFGCLDCHGNVTHHGSDPRDITPGIGFLHKPDRRDIPAMCGRCHSDAAFMKRYNPMLRVDEVAEYRTSVHGKRLLEMGDTAVATCIDCHPAHRILPPSDPASSVYPTHVAETCGRCHSDPNRMARYGIPTDQVKRWTESVHGQQMLKNGDTSAPTCNDCHGNHGATPPGVSDVPHVCGQCHATVADIFAGNGHDSLFAANGLPGCVTCHSNHDIVKPSEATLTNRAHTVCDRCHQAGSSDARQFLTMRTLIDSLSAAQVHSQGVLDHANNLGMDVSQAQFELSDVTTALTKARTAIHSFRSDSVAREVSTGLKTTSDAARQGQAALAEHRYRRIGLALSVPFILGVAAALWLRLRVIEADQRREEHDQDDDDAHRATSSTGHSP